MTKSESADMRAKAGAPDAAERRQLTIMFADLADSTGLSVRLDPEDLRDVIAAYQRVCVKSVERYNGYIARYVGDGILSYFGYPTAHEDDAERAIRAGIELVDAVAGLDRQFDQLGDLRLGVRVGIATGLVVVGDVIAEGVSDRGAVAGEAANLAARLQAMASPGTVDVSAVTRQLAAERFEYQDLGAHHLKGFADPVRAYRVIRQREVTRLEARGSTLTPFVNREDQIQLLLSCWERAARGNGQVVVISGEAGIGKSRIAAEFAGRIQRLDAIGPIALTFQCSPFHLNAPLYPVTRYLERLADLRPTDPGSVKLDKLGALFGHGESESRDNISLIADLLGLEHDDRYPTVNLSPLVKRHRIIETLAEWCAGHGRDRPVMIVFEDAQWIDPTSKLFINRLVSWAETACALIVITLRTRDRAGADVFLKDCALIAADGRYPAYITVLAIRELDAIAAKSLAAAAVGLSESALQTTRLAAILSRSEGIPLYIEELTKAAASAIEIPAVQKRGDEASAVPATITDSLMAQLDQLGPAKDVAQHASVMGHEFSASLVAEAIEKPIEELTPELSALIESRIIIPVEGVVDTYRFRHTMIRDISYRSVLRKNRRRIHLRVANLLARAAPETVAVGSDLIAQHYSFGDAPLEAIKYWQRGASQAIARSSYEEALAMLQSALLEIKRLHGTGWAALELALVLAEATALRSIHGYSAPEVEQRLIRARELCTLSADTKSRFNVEWGLFQCTIVKGDIIRARELAMDLLEHAGRHPDQPLVDAYLANGMVAFNAGDFGAAVRLLETGAGLSRPETDRPHFLTHGQNPGLFCLSYLARTQCIMGDLDRGRATIERALAIARALSHDPGLTYGYVNTISHAMRVYHLCGDLDAEERFAGEALQMSRRNHYSYYQAVCTCHLGWVSGMKGALGEGIEQVTGGLSTLRRAGALLALPGFHLLLSQLYLRAGRLAEAERELGNAATSQGFALWDAEIERIRAEIATLRTPPDWAAAEVAYRSGLDIARRQRAGLLAFKTGLSYARLLRRLNREKESHELLEHCLAQLHGGEHLAEAREARIMMNKSMTTL